MWTFRNKLKNLEHAKRVPCSRSMVNPISAKSIQNLFEIVKQGGQLPSLRHYAYSSPESIDLSKPTQNITSYSVAVQLAKDNQVYNDLRETHERETREAKVKADFDAKVESEVQSRLSTLSTETNT